MTLALNGGTPVRPALLPYGRQSIDEDDIAAVCEVLRGDWLTTGPHVTAFEAALASTVGTQHAVAVSNGTAALHAAYACTGIGPGDEVIVPAITFAATANAALYVGATPVVVDVDPDTLLLDPRAASAALTSRTRALVGVDYAGQPCDWPALRRLADAHGLALFADGCHALGAALDGVEVGGLADATTFSFHPVKHVAAGEGGAITTADDALAAAMRRFRTHGISKTAEERAQAGTWAYEMVALGYNYRLTDFQCALAGSQLTKLAGSVSRRSAIARQYDEALADLPGVRPLDHVRGRHAHHLYVVRWEVPGQDRRFAFSALRAENIGVNVHYLPVHLHAYYQERFGTGRGLCPQAEAAYDCILTLPLFPTMSDADVRDVVEAVRKVAAAGPQTP